MKEKSKQKIRITVVFIILIIIFINIPINILQYKFKLNDNDYKDKNSNNLNYLPIVTDSPGNFTLSYNEYEVKKYKSFNIYWTNSSGADNYSIYESDEYITEINGNTDLIKNGIKALFYKISYKNYSTNYYIAVAYNETGNITSNCIRINSDWAEKALLMTEMGISIYFLVILIIIFGLIFSLSTILSSHLKQSRLKEYRPKEKRKPKSIQKIESSNRYKNSIKSSRELLDENTDNRALLEQLKTQESQENIELKKKIELTSISEDFLKRVDKFKWKNEGGKLQFIREMLTLTPEEREDILDYMFQKAEKKDFSS